MAGRVRVKGKKTAFKTHPHKINLSSVLIYSVQTPILLVCAFRAKHEFVLFNFGPTRDVSKQMFRVSDIPNIGKDIF